MKNQYCLETFTNRYLRGRTTQGIHLIDYKT